MNAKSAATIAVLAALLFSTTALQAQQRDDFLRPFFGYYEAQPLSAAIGNATVAAGQIIPGRTSNPANLGLNRFGHLQAGFQHNRFNGPDAKSSTTRFGGLFAIYPVPVYRGSLVFGAGIDRVTDFSSAFKTATKDAIEEGGMNDVELGMAWEASENVFIGSAFHILRGQDEFSTTERDTNRLLSPDYRGVYFSLGFVNRTTDRLQIGGSVDFPASIEVWDKLTTWREDRPFESRTQTWTYKLRAPLKFHLGAAWLEPSFGFFYELEMADWGDMEFSSSQYFEGDVAEINRELSELKTTLTHHLGAAYHFSAIPLHLYSGYQYMPVAFGGVYKGNRRQSASLGGSYLLSQQFSLQTSYSYYFWTYSDRAENFGSLLFGTALHF